MRESLRLCQSCLMVWLRWIEEAKSTGLVLVGLLLTGAVMSIGMVWNPSLLGRMLHHDFLYFHKGLAMGVLPLLFFRIPTKIGWTENLARLLIVTWLTFLALSPMLESGDANSARVAICVAIAGFAGLRILSVDRDSSDSLFDTACIIAVGIVFAGYLSWLLPIFIVLCSIAKLQTTRLGGIPRGLLAVCIMCLVSWVLAGFWSNEMWILVFVSGLAVCVFAWKGAATCSRWSRRISRLQVIVFVQVLVVSCLLGIAPELTEIRLRDTLMASTIAHFFWAVPILGWLQPRIEPKGAVAWAAIGIVVFGYHLLAWSHLILGRGGMPWGYFAYDGAFSFGFLLAGVAAVAATLGAIMFGLWHRKQPLACPEARVVKPGS